jgi:protein TonB
MIVKTKIFFSLFLLFFVSSFAVAQSGGTQKSIPVAEHYEGGKEALLADIQKSIAYPPVAKRNRVHGECIVAFTLEEDGKIVNQKLIKNIGAGCGEEAMRVVKNLRFKAPGYRVDATVPVRFNLPSSNVSTSN